MDKKKMTSWDELLDGIRENISYIERTLNSDAILGMEQGNIQMLIEQKYICEVMLEAVQKEVDRDRRTD